LSSKQLAEHIDMAGRIGVGQVPGWKLTGEQARRGFRLERGRKQRIEEKESGIRMDFAQRPEVEMRVRRWQ